jgi:hypothetical protein
MVIVVRSIPPHVVGFFVEILGTHPSWLRIDIISPLKSEGSMASRHNSRVTVLRAHCHGANLKGFAQKMMGSWSNFPPDAQILAIFVSGARMIHLD